MFIRRVLPLAIAMLAVLTIVSTTAGATIAAGLQGHQSTERVAAMRWCPPGGCR